MDGASRLGRRLGRRCVGFPNLGPWIVVATWGGACLGTPLFLWLDPLARFTGAFSPGGYGLQTGPILAIAAFLAMLVLSVLWANAWCARVCPLGACQDLLFSLSRFCRCRLGRRRVAAPPDLGVPVPRRILLGAAAGAAWAGTTRLLGSTRPPPLRPPGAVAESAFRGLCTRCGNCLRVCPSGVIEQDLGSSGWAGFLTPVLQFRKGHCREDCVRCTQVCPSGALERVPLAKKADVRLGLPRVDMSLCLLGEDRECSLCRSRCPYGAIRYVFCESDYTLTPQVDPDRCNGCGACEAACPTKPKKAIVVVPI
jgi:ferredoxin-type protein NapF